MAIYIECAFLENFLFDGALLTLALIAAKIKLKWRRIVLSACMGAVFAIVFPLLRLSAILGTVLKLSMGFLICMVAFGQLKTRKEWGRYALTSVFFFCLSFGFGGALLGIYGQFEEGANRMSSVAVFLGFTILSAVAVFLIRKLYARRAVFQSVYPCKIYSGEKQIATQGFLDSGNLAMKRGVPVCFASPDLIYDLWGEELMGKDIGQVCDEIQISTLAGEKKVPLYKAEIEVNEKKIQVYFAPSANMIGREYKVLLHSELIGENHETDRTR